MTALREVPRGGLRKEGRMVQLKIAAGIKSCRELKKYERREMKT